MMVLNSFTRVKSVFSAFQGMTVLGLAFLLLAAVSGAAMADWVTIEPDRKYVNSCLPFGIGDPSASSGHLWYPYTVFVYQNVPAFTLQTGDTLAFDLTAENDADIGLAISMAPAAVNGGKDNAIPFVQVVSNTQSPGRGDTVMGNYDLEFTSETTFHFEGGGLLIRFSDPSPSYQEDDTCTHNLLSGNGWDDTGYFLTRFVHDSDGLPPWDQESNIQIGAFRVENSPLSYGLEKTALDITGTETDHSAVGDTLTYRIRFTNGGSSPITGIGITDTLPGEMAYAGASAAPAASVTYDAGPPATVLWSPESVAAGGTASLDIEVQVLGSADGKLVQNRAEVTAIGQPHSTGLSDHADVMVGAAADLQVSIEVDDYVDLYDDDWAHALNIYFIFTVRNNGPSTATNIRFENDTTTDPYLSSEKSGTELFWYREYPYAEGVQSCNVTPPTMTCHLDDLGPGESTTFFQRFKMDVSGEDVDLTYDARVGSGSVDPASYEVDDPEPASNQISGTTTAVRSGGGGSGGCSTSGPGPGWPGLGVTALVLLILFRMRRQGG